jgi:hypothetical protein
VALCITADEREQIEIILPDGRKVVVIVLKLPGRSLANVKLSIIAPKDIKVERRTRKSPEENNS